MGIDLRLLRYFVVTSEQGSANRAAGTLHVTQPALSRQLRQLEKQLGLVLFERDGRGLRLTSAGERFASVARELLTHADRVERAASSLASGRLHEIRLAVPTTTLTDVLAPFLATLAPDDPMPIVRTTDSRGGAAALDAGADLAIVTRPPAAGLAVTPLAVLPVWAYVPAGDPWAGRREIAVADLVERPVVVLTEEFRPRTLLDAAVDEAGLSYGSLLECTNAQVAQALAAAGRGVAVVSDDPRFGLVPLSIAGTTGPVRIRLFAVWDAGHHAAAALEAFAARIADFCAQRYGPSVRP